MAAAPEATWNRLCEQGLDGELPEAVRERYGFDQPLGSPARWVEDFVATLALTEAFLGYDEPEDFPFVDLLPPPALRAHHQQLLRRWLRDSEARPAWDRK